MKVILISIFFFTDIAHVWQHETPWTFPNITACHWYAQKHAKAMNERFGTEQLWHCKKVYRNEKEKS